MRFVAESILESCPIVGFNGLSIFLLPVGATLTGGRRWTNSALNLTACPKDILSLLNISDAASRSSRSLITTSCVASSPAIFKKWVNACNRALSFLLCTIIIHQTHCEKSDWSRAFNQFTIACELDMRNVVSAEDITFIMSSSTSAWLLSPLECSQQMNAFSCQLFKNCIIKQLLDSVFAWYHELSNPRVCVICLPYLTTIKARSEKPNQAKASSSRSNAMFHSCSLVIPTLKCLSYSFPKQSVICFRICSGLGPSSLVSFSSGLRVFDDSSTTSCSAISNLHQLRQCWWKRACFGELLFI